MRRSFSVATFVLNDGAVLLIRHKRLGLWLPVGGEFETVLTDLDLSRQSETPHEAAAREVLEETGLQVVFARDPFALDGEPDGFLGYEEHVAGDKGLHMNFNFVAHSTRRDVKSDGSFTDHGWFQVRGGPGGFPDPTTKSTWQCIKRIANKMSEGRLS